MTASKGFCNSKVFCNYGILLVRTMSSVDLPNSDKFISASKIPGQTRRLTMHLPTFPKATTKKKEWVGGANTRNMGYGESRKEREEGTVVDNCELVLIWKYPRLQLAPKVHQGWFCPWGFSVTSKRRKQNFKPSPCCC